MRFVFCKKGLTYIYINGIFITFWTILKKVAWQIYINGLIYWYLIALDLSIPYTYSLYILYICI